MIAVAISVGFAGRLVQMNWIKGTQFVWPTANEWIVLLRLVVGIFVVVSGWEWYHRDIRDRPLNRPWRFYIDIAVVITTILFLFSSEGRSLAVFAGLDFRPVSFVGCGFGAGVQNHSCASSDMVRVRHECDVVGVFHLPSHQERQQAHRDLFFRPFGNASIARLGRIPNTAGAYAPGLFDQVDFRSWVGRPLPFRRSVLLALRHQTSSSAIFSSYPFSFAIATPSRAS
jgi:hypothetical protein